MPNTAYQLKSITKEWSDWIARNRERLEHPANFEERFVRDVLTQVDGLTPNDVSFQYPFTDFEGKGREIDFLIKNAQKGWALAIELDGATKLQKDDETIDYQAYTDFLERQNGLMSFGLSTKSGLLLVRFTNKRWLKYNRDTIAEIEHMLKKQTEQFEERKRQLAEAEARGAEKAKAEAEEAARVKAAAEEAAQKREEQEKAAKQRAEQEKAEAEKAREEQNQLNKNSTIQPVPLTTKGASVHESDRGQGDIKARLTKNVLEAKKFVERAESLSWRSKPIKVTAIVLGVLAVIAFWKSMSSSGPEPSEQTDLSHQASSLETNVAPKVTEPQVHTVVIKVEAPNMQPQAPQPIVLSSEASEEKVIPVSVSTESLSQGTNEVTPVEKAVPDTDVSGDQGEKLPQEVELPSVGVPDEGLHSKPRPKSKVESVAKPVEEQKAKVELVTQLVEEEKANLEQVTKPVEEEKSQPELVVKPIEEETTNVEQPRSSSDESVNTLATNEALDYIGETKTVCGILKEIRPRKSDNYLNFDAYYPNNHFTAVIPDEFARRFMGINQKIDQRVCAHGRIERIGRKAAIKLVNATQLIQEP